MAILLPLIPTPFMSAKAFRPRAVMTILYPVVPKNGNKRNWSATKLVRVDRTREP